MSETAPLLQLESVNTHIGPYHILQGVELAVPRGGLTMLLGRNGAGKTTTLRTIMGLWQASAGRVRFDGAEITDWPTPDIARAGIAYVPENMGIFADLTVRENLLLAARSGDIDDARLRWVFGLFPALKKFWSLPAGFLSGGQKQMLSIARAVIEPRELFLIDEPTKGLAPAIIGNMIAAFRELKQTAATILLVEQNFMFAKSLGDAVAVMDNGRVAHAALPLIGSLSTWATLTAAGLAMGMIIFIIASGLTLVFGLMDVLNFGHGAFISVGAYVAAILLAPLSGLLQADSLVLNGVALLALIALAMIATGLLGWAFERIIIMPVYGQHLKQILVTVGGMIVAQQLIIV